MGFGIIIALILLAVILICGFLKRVLVKAILCGLIYLGVSYVVGRFLLPGRLSLIVTIALFVLCLILIFGKKKRRR